MSPRFAGRESLAGAIMTDAVPPSMAFTQGAPVEVLAHRNTSSFRTHRWQDRLDDLSGWPILSDTRAGMQQNLSEDGTRTRVYPTSVPMTDDITRPGHTRAERKAEGPSWRPTPSLKARNPECSDDVGPGPDNPLYPGGQCDLVHGTTDTRKLGRRGSNGCTGLCNGQIEELLALARGGTRLKLKRGARG